MRQRAAKVLRFFDWRFFASVTACGLVLISALAIYATIQGNAIADRSRDRASHRITSLNKRIGELTDLANENSERIGALLTKTDALAEQVRQLGGTPVVEGSRSSSSTTTTQPRRPRIPGSSSRPPTTTRPSSPPTTDPPPPPPPTVACVPVVRTCI